MLYIVRNIVRHVYVARLAASGQLSTKEIYSPVSRLQMRHNMGRIQGCFKEWGEGSRSSILFGK